MIYNVVLNSANKVAGDNVSNYAYYFNWSNVEEGEYEMSFSFNAVGSAVSKSIAVVITNLGVSTNAFTTKGLTAQSFNNVVGTIYPTINASTSDYVVGSTYNPPVYLQSRPHSNEFSVYLYDTASALTDIGVDYLLTLSLKKI